MVITSGSTLPYVESRYASSTPRYSPYNVSGGSIPTSASVASSAQSSTTTAILEILSLNFFGNFLSAFSTNASNCLRFIPPPSGSDFDFYTFGSHSPGRSDEMLRSQSLTPRETMLWLRFQYEYRRAREIVENGADARRRGREE